MTEVSAPGNLTTLSIAGFKSALQSQRALASVVTSALENVTALNDAAAAQAAAPSNGRGQVVDTSA